jgi:hypothetical protein
MAERAGEPTFADAGRPAPDQVLMSIDPVVLGKFLEESAIETTGGAVIDIFNRGLILFLGRLSGQWADWLGPNIGRLHLKWAFAACR